MVIDISDIQKRYVEKMAGLSEVYDSSKGATWALIIGAIIGAFRIIAELFNNAGYVHSIFLINIVQMNLLHFAIFLFIVSASVLLFVSLMTNPPVRAKVTGLTFATAHEVQTEFTQMVES